MLAEYFELHACARTCRRRRHEKNKIDRHRHVHERISTRTFSEELTCESSQASTDDSLTERRLAPSLATQPVHPRTRARFHQSSGGTWCCACSLRSVQSRSKELNSSLRAQTLTQNLAHDHEWIIGSIGFLTLFVYALYGDRLRRLPRRRRRRKRNAPTCARLRAIERGQRGRCHWQ